MSSRSLEDLACPFKNPSGYHFGIAAQKAFERNDGRTGGMLRASARKAQRPQERGRR